jgi:hypothetical protein
MPDSITPESPWDYLSKNDPWCIAYVNRLANERHAMPWQVLKDILLCHSFARDHVPDRKYTREAAKVGRNSV